MVGDFAGRCINPAPNYFDPLLVGGSGEVEPTGRVYITAYNTHYDSSMPYRGWIDKGVAGIHDVDGNTELVFKDVNDVVIFKATADENAMIDMPGCVTMHYTVNAYPNEMWITAIGEGVLLTPSPEPSK